MTPAQDAPPESLHVGHEALPHHRGEGWEVWLDEERILWTRDTLPQHAIAAARRVEALEEVLAKHKVRGILVDDRKFGGGDTEAATATYRDFMARHPGLPVAVVTTHQETLRLTFILRSTAKGSNLQVFRTLQAAKAWLVKLEGWMP